MGDFFERTPMPESRAWSRFSLHRFFLGTRQTTAYFPSTLVPTPGPFLLPCFSRM